MSLKNSVKLIGNTGKDPETKHLENGNQVTNISLATTEKYKNKQGEVVEDTQWHNLTAWGKTSQLFEKWVKKGSKIAVEGKLTTRSYEDKNGDKKYITEVVVNELLMLGDNPQASSSSTPKAAARPKPQPVAQEEDDDLPF